MNDARGDGSDYIPDIDEPLRDSRGNLIDDYLDELGREAEIGYDLERLTATRGDRPSLSEVGDSPQMRFRLSATTRAEAVEVAAREGKTLSQLARDAVETYLEAPPLGMRGSLHRRRQDSRSLSTIPIVDQQGPILSESKSG